MSSAFTYSTAAVTLLLVYPSASDTQNGNHSSVMAPTVELLDNRNTYCPGETARIRCNIAGSGNESDVVYDWIIDSATFDPATITLSGHTVSSSDHFVLQVLQTNTYSANYSCSRRIARDTYKSKAKRLIFSSK